jgi:ribosomal protein S18 acetylase RimI-like enzyme
MVDFLIFNMTEQLKIRKATMKDFDKIYSLSDELLGNPIGNRKMFFRMALNNKNYLCLVAELNKEVVGFIDMWSFPDVSHGAYLAQLQNLIVTKKLRGRGIATKLVKETIKIFKTKNYHELHIWTQKDNKVAIGMYKRCGLKDESILLEMEN